MKMARLGDHAKFLSGFAFKSKFFNDDGMGLPVIRIRDVVRGHSETFYSGEYDERYLVFCGEYLIGMDGEFNLAQWQSEKALLNQRVCKIDSISDDTDRDYLGRFLPVALKEIEDATPFVTVKHLSVKTLNEIQIPLPPLAEQKRIAKILDAADALSTKRRESIAQLDTLLQSTFLDMFGDPVTNPMGWELVELGAYATKVGSGSTPRGGNDSYKAEGIALIRSLNVRDGVFQWAKLARIDETQAAKLSNVIVEHQDVLLNITGASVARVCRAPKSVIPARVNQHVCIIRPKPAIEPCFLEKLLLAKPMKQKLLGIGEAGATRQAITKAQVLALAIPFPPIDLQHRFAAIVKSIEQQKVSQCAHLAELDTLFAALQQRAFNGTL